MENFLNNNSDEIILLVLGYIVGLITSLIKPLYICFKKYIRKYYFKTKKWYTGEDAIKQMFLPKEKRKKLTKRQQKYMTKNNKKIIDSIDIEKLHEMTNTIKSYSTIADKVIRIKNSTNN